MMVSCRLKINVHAILGKRRPPTRKAGGRIRLAKAKRSVNSSTKRHTRIPAGTMAGRASVPQDVCPCFCAIMITKHSFALAVANHSTVPYSALRSITLKLRNFIRAFSWLIVVLCEEREYDGSQASLAMPITSEICFLIQLCLSWGGRRVENIER